MTVKYDDPDGFAVEINGIHRMLTQVQWNTLAAKEKAYLIYG